MTIAVHHGDCREIAPTLGPVDAVVTDPPYHLTATVKRFGKNDSAPAQYGRDGAMTRLSGGFMGQQWDGGDIAFRPETWAAIAEPLKPGGFLLAFGGTRTWHRMACAIEDSGLVIQDTIAWVYGSGFPKNRAMLKPAFEPIVLAYKPGGKRSMQIDECRIEGGQIKSAGGSRRSGGIMGNTSPLGGWEPTAPGRWPANLCHDGSDEVVSLFPQSKGSVGEFRRNASLNYESTVQIAGRNQEVAGIGYADSGSAARFFYSAKADKQDRWGSRHATVKPVDLMKWLVALVTPPGGTVLDPFSGSGTTGVAAVATGRSAILIELEDQYVADIRERVAFYDGEGRHSVAAKARSRTPREPMPLFDDAGAA